MPIGLNLDYNYEMPRLFVVTLIFCFAAFFSACGNNATNNAKSTSGQGAANQNSNSVSIRNDVEELGVRVTIPFETEEAVWREFAAEKKLVAVLRFTPQDSAKIVSEAEKIRPPTRVEVTAETWFPPELIAQADMSGDDRLVGGSYAANGFLLPPYTEGSLVRIDNTDYFILQVIAR